MSHLAATHSAFGIAAPSPIIAERPTADALLSRLESYRVANMGELTECGGAVWRLAVLRWWCSAGPCWAVTGVVPWWRTGSASGVYLDEKEA